MSQTINVWGKLLSILRPRKQGISPEVARGAHYSYRNYRGDEGAASAPRSESRSRSRDERFVNAAPTSTELQYCRS